MSIEPIPLDQLDGKRAKFYYVPGLEEVTGDHTHFKLGDIDLSVVGRQNSNSWDFAEVGTLFSTRTYYRKEFVDKLEYSEPILVLIKTKFYVKDESESSSGFRTSKDYYLLTFLEPDTYDIIAYLKIVYPEDNSQSYTVFKVLKPNSSNSVTELEQLLLM